MLNKNRGLFISFEGGEASGKTTQIKKIEKWLKANKLKYISTREPGGTKLSEFLRTHWKSLSEFEALTQRK